MSALEENSTQASQLPDIGNTSVKIEENHYFRSNTEIADGVQNIPVKSEKDWKSTGIGDSGDTELVGARFQEDFYKRKFLESSFVFFCDICGAHSIERGIKLNLKERATANVAIKALSRLNQQKISTQVTPEKSCSGCFTQITLLTNRVKGKLLKHKLKRTQNMSGHGQNCICVNCYDPLSILFNEQAVQTVGNRESGIIPVHIPNQELQDPILCPPDQIPYETQQQSIQAGYTTYGYQQQLPNYISNDGYFPMQQHTHQTQNPPNLYSNVPHFINAPSTSLQEVSSLPTSVQHFEAHNQIDLNQPSTSRGFPSQSEDEPSSRKIKKTCSHCSKEFTHTGDFKKHLRTHTKERPFTCSQCDKSFPHSSNLRRHQRSHLNDRPYKCEHCHKEFNRKDKLVSHKKSKSCKSKRYEANK